MTTIKKAARNAKEKIECVIVVLIALIWNIGKDVFWCLAGFAGILVTLMIFADVLSGSDHITKITLYSDQLVKYVFVMIVTVIVMKLRNKK